MPGAHIVPRFWPLLLLLLALVGCGGTPSIDQPTQATTPRPIPGALADRSAAPTAPPTHATAAPPATPAHATATPTYAPAAPTAAPSAPPTLTAATANDPCVKVTRIPPDSEEARRIGQALLAEIPRRVAADLATRSFEFDEIRSIDRVDDWVLFQASFKAYLEPAIFVVRVTPDGYRYDGEGWGGQAESAAQIRGYLASRLHEAPPELFACLEPAEWFIR
jgi:hypothetical protein